MTQIPIFKERIALGKIPYADKYLIRGVNLGLSNSAETVWAPGALYAKLTAASAMEVVSDSASDTAAGTGARTVYVEGLDSSYNVVSETKSLNGTTPVALTNTYIAINKFKVATSGTGLCNAGNVDVRVASAGAVQKRINTGTLGLGQSACFHFTVPALHLGLLSDIRVSLWGASDNVTIYLITKDTAGNILVEGEVITDSGVASIDFGQEGLAVEEKTLIELRAITASGVGKISAMAELYTFHKKNFGFI